MKHNTHKIEAMLTPRKIANNTHSSFSYSKITYNYKKLKAEHHRMLRDKAGQLGYKPSVVATLHELLNCADMQGVTNASQSRIAYKLRCSTRTVQRHINRFIADGILSVSKKGWKQTNTVTFLAVQHLMLNKCDKKSHDLNTPESNINTYIENDVCVFDDLGKIEDPPPRRRALQSEKHIDEGKLNTNERESEIRRACKLYNLSTEHTEYAVKRMDDKRITNPGGFLSFMCSAIATGAWKMPNPNSEPSHTKTAHAQAQREWEAIQKRYDEFPVKRRELNDYERRMLADCVKICRGVN